MGIFSKRTEELSASLTTMEWVRILAIKRARFNSKFVALEDEICQKNRRAKVINFCQSALEDWLKYEREVMGDLYRN